MMLYPAMSELLEQVPSRYKLVNVVAARARKIAAKAERENIMLEDKPVSIAIRRSRPGTWTTWKRNPPWKGRRLPGRRTGDPLGPGGGGPPGGRNRGSLICSHDRGQDCPLGGHLCH